MDGFEMACLDKICPGASPKPPISPEHRSLRMSPNKFVVTRTSNRLGFITNCIAQLSTIISSNSMVA